MRKSANYPGIFQVYPGFVRYTRKILGFLPILLILAPKQPQTRLRALKNDDFHGVSPRKLEGAVGKRAGNTERKSGRVREETCIQPKPRGAVVGCGLACTSFSGKQKGKQRVPSTLRFRKFPGKAEVVFGAPFWKLANFPESESWSGAKSEREIFSNTKPLTTKQLKKTTLSNNSTLTRV